jgi:hypothetical protein
MSTQYFQACANPQEVKTLYRQLARENHPDIGGDTRTMQDINAQYQRALQNLNGYKTVGTDGKERTYKYNPEYEEGIMAKVAEILDLRLPHIDIQIIGLWIWVTGTKKEDRDHFNKHGVKMSWHSKRSAWYWKPYAGRSTYSKRDTLDSLAAKYGRTRVHQHDDERKPRRQPSLLTP